MLAALPLPAESLSIIIVASLGAHLVFQFLPAIFFSIPDDTVVASVLPGNRMALEGRGAEALVVCAFSSLLATAGALLMLPLSLAFLPIAYSAIEPYMAFVLILASLFLILSEAEAKKIAMAGFVFALSGMLGGATLVSAIKEPLFPAFCGLFAASGILLSLSSASRLPEQKSEKTKLDFLPYVALGTVFGMLSDLLAGMAAPAQIAVFASALLPAKEDPKKFLALVSSIAASHTVFAFSALVSIGKAREGSLAIINSLMPITESSLPALFGALLLSVGASSLFLMLLSKRAHKLSGVDFRPLNLAVLAYLFFAVLIISGAEGLLLFATSAAIGILPPLLGVRRTHVMGLIIVPSIFLHL